MYICIYVYISAVRLCVKLDDSSNLHVAFVIPSLLTLTRPNFVNEGALTPRYFRRKIYLYRGSIAKH